MLQVISEKYFIEGQPINEENIKKVLYSNYFWINTIETDLFRIIPTGSYKNKIACYVIEFTNKYQPVEKDYIVMPISNPIIDQIRLLCTFYFKAFFHEEKINVELKCRKNPRNDNDAYIPSNYITSFFDSRIEGNNQQIIEFNKFLQRVIGMPREKYKLLITFLNTLYNSLEAFETNFEVSYITFVYLLESVIYDKFEYIPIWDDYDQSIKSKLDKIFSSIDNYYADEIKTLLIQGKNFKLTKRFVNGIIDMIDNKYFTTESENLNKAITPSEMKRTLENLYQSRSGYVHQLKELNENIKLSFSSSKNDYLEWDNEPYFTISGLIRLTHHVLMNFVWKQDIIEKEDYNWREDLPGVITAKLAPKYWIWKSEGFNERLANNYFNGLVKFIFFNLKNDKAFPDLSGVISEIEKILDNSKKTNIYSLLGYYHLYNRSIKDEFKSDKYSSIIEKNKKYFNECKIQWLCIDLLENKSFLWDTDICLEEFNRYKKKKYKKSDINLPKIIEIAIMLNIANKYLEDNNHENYKSILENSILESSGKTNIQQKIKDSLKNKVKINTFEILDIR